MRTVLIFLLLVVLAFALRSLDSSSESPLHDVVMVIDPGHGDRASGLVPADPGAQVDCNGRVASECVFTWDTAMRLRRLAESRGAKVFLTLEAPDKDYQPHSWESLRFPEAGSPDFPFRILVETPEPESVSQALESRVATANRIYSHYRRTNRVYFFSLHFDSTSPALAGVSFYTPLGTGRSPQVESLCRAIRNAGRERRSLVSQREYGLVSEHAYCVLSRSENPNAFLVELANMRSQDALGGNPDLWRMRNGAVREEYAAMIVEAVEAFPSRDQWLVECLLLLGLGLLLRQLKLKVVQQ